MSYIDDDVLYRFNASLVNEYNYCEKLFWLHFNKLQIFQGSESAKIGEQEHKSKEGESRNPWIKYDDMRNGKLIEYTKKKKDLNGKRLQLLIYLLRSKKSAGKIRETNTDELLMKVDVTESSEKELFIFLKNMTSISLMTTPPIVNFNENCKKCSFKEYCWVGKR